jgi:hypothetical protein
MLPANVRPLMTSFTRQNVCHGRRGQT